MRSRGTAATFGCSASIGCRYTDEFVRDIEMRVRGNSRSELVAFRESVKFRREIASQFAFVRGTATPRSVSSFVTFRCEFVEIRGVSSCHLENV